MKDKITFDAIGAYWEGIAKILEYMRGIETKVREDEQKRVLKIIQIIKDYNKEEQGYDDEIFDTLRQQIKEMK